MHREKAVDRTYQQRDTARIQYQAPVNSTVQDSATHFHGGQMTKDKKMTEQDRMRMNADSVNAARQRSNTGTEVKQRKGEKNVHTEGKTKAVGRDTTKNMYLIKKDSSDIRK